MREEDLERERRGFWDWILFWWCFDKFLIWYLWWVFVDLGLGSGEVYELRERVYRRNWNRCKKKKVKFCEMVLFEMFVIII